MGEVPDHRPDDITILDMEASIEHVNRGTIANVDVLLVVTEPYYRSLETTKINLFKKINNIYISI